MTAGKECYYIRKISCLIILILILFPASLHSQRTRNEPPPLRERIFFGGSFGLQLGTITDIQVSPIAGIWVLPRVAIALGPTYRFYKDYFTKTDLYGGRGYVQFAVIQNLSNIIPIGSNTGIFLHLEDELLSLESAAWKSPPYSSDRFFVNTVLAGAGLSQQIGKRAAVNMMVLWAVNESDYNIYSNPEIRVSFTF